MQVPDPTRDPLGQAVTDYYLTGKSKNIVVTSDIAEDDVIPSAYLFRNKKEMPAIEQQAIELCQGKILDVGAAAGAHSLALQKMDKQVTALEISSLCCNVMNKRGVQNIVNEDFFSFSSSRYDTLLLMMNGIGIAGTLSGLDSFLGKASSLLHPGGKVLFDSSDISYLFEEEDGSRWVNLNSQYQGELKYAMSFEETKGAVFPWLFIDFETLRPIAAKHGFDAQLVASGEHYDYLGMLTKK